MDIVERLRDVQQYAITLSDDARSSIGQAADEIERLQAAVAAERERWDGPLDDCIRAAEYGNAIAAAIREDQ